MNADVIVIGSGISGLTTAALLAKAGRKVVVLERHGRPGGAIKRFTRQGIPFDIGFHYTGCLGDGEILRALWKYLDVLPRISLLPFPSDGCDCLHMKESGKIVRAFFDRDLLQGELERVFPDELSGIKGYLHRVEEICSTVPFYNTDLPLTPFLRGFSRPDGGLATFLSSLTDDEDLQSALASPSFLYGVPPEAASLAVHAMVAYSYFSGAYSIDGGGQAIVDAFLSVLNTTGAQVLCGRDVRSITVKNGHVTGVDTGEEEIRASDVVFTGHPSGVLNMVPDEIFRPAYRHRLRDLKNTLSMFVVFGAVEYSEKVRELTWVNRYSVPGGLNIMDVNQEHPEESTLLLTAPGLRDKDFALSEATSGVILMRAADWNEAAPFDQGRGPRRSPAYREWKDEAAAKLIEKAEQLWDDIGKIRLLAAGTPLTFRDELAAPMGAVYGPQHSLDQHNPGARTRLPGLWLSGQGTLMTGVMGSSLAGLVTAGEMNDLEFLWQEVKKCL